MVFAHACAAVVGAPSCGRAGPAGGKDSPPDLARPRPCNLPGPRAGTPPASGRDRPALVLRRLGVASPSRLRGGPPRGLVGGSQPHPAEASRCGRPVPRRTRPRRGVPVRGGSLRADHGFRRPRRSGRHARPRQQGDAMTLSHDATQEARPGILARILMLPIRAWRLLSVHLPPRCRFHPSCSQYALDALALHGARRGTWLAVRRVSRCHPWHPGGHDPVPDPNVRSTHVVPQA